MKEKYKAPKKCRALAFLLSTSLVFVQSIPYTAIVTYAQENITDEDVVNEYIIADSGTNLDDNIVEDSDNSLNDNIVEDSDNSLDDNIVEDSDNSLNDSIVEDSDNSLDDSIVDDSHNNTVDSSIDDSDDSKETQSDNNSATSKQPPVSQKNSTSLDEMQEDSSAFQDDLIINLGDVDTLTPSMNKEYGTGDIDEYEPGIDNSPTDSVSTNSKVVYSINLSFESNSKEDYTFDNIKIQMVDDEGNVIKGTPIYYRNAVEDSLEIISYDSYYTTGKNADVASIIWPEDSQGNFKPGGAVNMSIAFDIGQSTIWDTMLSPSFQVICTKGKEKAVSEIFKLPQINLSSKAYFKTNFYGTDKAPQIDTEEKMIQVPFKISSGKANIPNINPLEDVPKFSSMTYQIKVNAAVDGKDLNAELTTDSFQAEVTKPKEGVDVSCEYDAEGSVLSVTLTPDEFSLQECYDTFLYISLPYSGVDKLLCPVSLNLSFADMGMDAVTFLDLENEALFDISAAGVSSFNKEVQLEQSQNSSELPMISDTISANTETGKISHQVSFSLNDVLDTSGMQIFQLLESEVYTFDDSASIKYKIGTSEFQELEEDAYTITYGQLPLPEGYESKPDLINQQNTVKIAQDFVSGQRILEDSANRSNIKCFTFNENFKELISAQNTEHNTITIEIEESGYKLEDRLDALKNTDKLAKFRGRLISMLTFPIISDEINWGEQINPADKATAIEKNTLILAARQYTDNSIERFGAVSTPRTKTTIHDYSDNYVLSLLSGTDGKQLHQVDNYDQEYLLNISRFTGYNSGKSTLKKGSRLTLTIPDTIISLMSLKENPYVMVSSSDKYDITEIQLNHTEKTITFQIPCDLDMSLSGSGIFIPISFHMPVASINVGADTTTLTVSGDCVLSKDGNLLDGISLHPLAFHIGYKGTDITFLHGNQDSQGLSVSNYLYEPDGLASFTGKIYNTTNDKHDYYGGFTVPTAKYNLNSPNDLNGYIESIQPNSNHSVSIYYLREADVKDSDIALMRSSIKINEGETLQKWYHRIAGGDTDWVLYTSDEALPDDVVMFIGYWKDLPSGSTALVNYHVKMDMSEAEPGIYQNFSDMKYYSANSQTETRSNRVMIETTKAASDSNNSGTGSNPGQDSDQGSSPEQAPDTDQDSNPEQEPNPNPPPQPDSNTNDTGGDSNSGDNGSVSTQASDTITIDGAPVPLASVNSLLDDAIKEPEIILTEIDDGEIPLSALPKTGEGSWDGVALLLSLLAILSAALNKKDRKKDKNYL